MRTLRLLWVVLLLSPALSLARDKSESRYSGAVVEGMSVGRFDRLSRVLEDYVQNGEYAGIVSLVARNGKIVDFRSHGYRDLEKKMPMEKDTIVRVYSMTKLVTSVAV